MFFSIELEEVVFDETYRFCNDFCNETYCDFDPEVLSLQRFFQKNLKRSFSMKRIASATIFA